MKLTVRLLCATTFAWFALTGARAESRLVSGQFENKLLPAALKFTVLLPDGYDSLAEPVPLLYFLHGGGGDNDFLKRERSLLDELWTGGKLPKLVIVTPDCDRS